MKDADGWRPVVFRQVTNPTHTIPVHRPCYGMPPDQFLYWFWRFRRWEDALVELRHTPIES
jgi:hypothetical protein